MYLRQQQHVEIELSHSPHSPHWVWFGNKQRPNSATMIRREDDELQGVGQIDNNYLMFYIIIFYIIYLVCIRILEEFLVGATIGAECKYTVAPKTFGAFEVGDRKTR